MDLGQEIAVSVNRILEWYQLILQVSHIFNGISLQYIGWQRKMQ